MSSQSIDRLQWDAPVRGFFADPCTYGGGRSRIQRTQEENGTMKVHWRIVNIAAASALFAAGSVTAEDQFGSQSLLPMPQVSQQVHAYPSTAAPAYLGPQQADNQRVAHRRSANQPQMPEMPYEAYQGSGGTHAPSPYEQAMSQPCSGDQCSGSIP